MNKLKQFREKAAMSQLQLSIESGINVRMIQHYEQGVKDMNKANAITIYKLSKALGCNMEDLIEL